ncbi:MAG TPA: hypothetical protein VK848_03555 [Acidimicrobiia bacterium]|nr:hypothetical protein [Acidimicrobiia bacterium]
MNVKPAVRTSVAGGTVVSTAVEMATSTRVVGSTAAFEDCSHGLAGMVQVAVPDPTCVTRMPRRWLSGGAYPDLVADPAGTAHHVSAAVGLPTDDGLTGEIAAFLESQRSGGRAAPPPELPTMGYIHDAVLSDPVVSAYCRRFGVQPERSRLTGVHSPA